MFLAGSGRWNTLKNYDDNTTSVIDTAAKTDTAINPIALVYRGPAGCADCSEKVAALLESDTIQNFNVIYVGPNEKLSIKDGLQLPNAVLYVQPGGDESVNKAFHKLKKHAPDVHNFVWKGGRYLGICMGAYLVDNDPGYDLGLNTNQYIKTSKAALKTTAGTLIQVTWRGTPRWMYFQDGPYFIPGNVIADQTILATYMNGKVAAMVQPYGSGKIVVSAHIQKQMPPGMRKPVLNLRLASILTSATI